MGNASTHTSNEPPRIAVTSVKIEQELLEQFRAVATANRRSFSGEMRWIMEKHVQAFQREQQREAA